jgi:hypothetical protein
MDLNHLIHKDAIYTVALIKETYPRLYDKIPDFDEQSTKFIQKIITNNN